MKAVQTSLFAFLILGINLGVIQSCALFGQLYKAYIGGNGYNEQALKKELADQFSEAMKPGSEHLEFQHYATSRIRKDVLAFHPECSILEDEATSDAVRKTILQRWLDMFSNSLEPVLAPVTLQSSIEAALVKPSVGGKPSPQVKIAVDSMRRYIDRVFFNNFLTYIMSPKCRPDSPERRTFGQLASIYFSKSQYEIKVVNSRLQRILDAQADSNIEAQFVMMLAEEFSFEDKKHIMTIPK